MIIIEKKDKPTKCGDCPCCYEDFELVPPLPDVDYGPDELETWFMCSLLNAPVEEEKYTYIAH